MLTMFTAGIEKPFLILKSGGRALFALRLPVRAFSAFFVYAFISALLLTNAHAQSLTEQLEQGLDLQPRPPRAEQDINAATKKQQSMQSLDALLTQDSVNPDALNIDSQQNLADQIETLKQTMVNLNRDLFILEEDLLFPSSTQVAVYLSMDVGEYFALDAVEIRIDGEVKTYYLYTERQVNALFRGGVQRLYVDNVNQGEHELTAYFVGIGPEHRDYKRAVSIVFTKEEDPVAIELSVIDSSNKQQPIFEAKTL